MARRAGQPPPKGHKLSNAPDMPVASPAPGTRLGDTLLRIWSRRGPAAMLLWPISLVYGLAVALRRGLYRLGVFKSCRVKAPVLVVGNVVAGGAGKTPVVLLLARHLRARGLHVGVISRGYGRNTRDCREVQADSAASEVGDEAKLVREATGVPVFVALQRHQAAAALLAQYPRTQLIISDDGLQHHALHRDLEICVFDSRGVGNGLLLPAGPLREPWPRHARHRPVDFLLHTGDIAAPDGAYHAPRRLSPFALTREGERIALAELATKPLLAVAGIAHPENFFAMLREEGIALAHTVALPDHYDFSSWKRPFGDGLQLICTEKDAVKLWPQHQDALAVPLILTPPPAFLSDLDQAVDRLLANNSLSLPHGHPTA